VHRFLCGAKVVPELCEHWPGNSYAVHEWGGWVVEIIPWPSRLLLSFVVPESHRFRGLHSFGRRVVFPWYSLDKGLMSRIYGELQKLNTKTRSPINKWANKLDRQFSKEQVQIASKNMKKCILKHKENAYQTPVRMVIIKKINDKCWQRCREKGNFYTIDGSIN
jgi:hypothetical protein